MDGADANRNQGASSVLVDAPVRRDGVRGIAGRYLPDLVYGANDGLITTFAVVSGVVGAGLAPRIILVLGFANLIADGFSMGASDYLAQRSLVAPAQPTARREAVRHGAATLVSFVVVGVVPLAAHLLPVPAAARFPSALGLTFVTLFCVGAARSVVTRLSWARGGAEMLAVGAVAAAVAYGIGALLGGITAGA